MDTYRVEYESGRSAVVEAASTEEAIDKGRPFIHWEGIIPTHHTDSSEAWAVYSLTEHPDPVDASTPDQLDAQALRDQAAVDHTD